MACKFSCFLSFSDSFKENDVGIFHSDDGDVYRVKYKSNVCRDLLMKIEWTISKRVLFTVKLYNTSFKRCFSSRGFVTNGKKTCIKLRGAFNVCNSRDYKILCIIECIKYIQFRECVEIPMESSDSGFIEPESLRLSMNENDKVNEDETKYVNENTEKNRNDSNNLDIKFCESIPQEDTSSETRLENVNKEVPPSKNGCLLDSDALTYGVKSKEPDMVTSKNSVSGEMPVLMKTYSSEEFNQNDELLKNDYESSDSDRFLKSQPFSENVKNTSEVNLLENNKNKLLKEPNMQTLEFVPLNDIVTDINEFAESKQLDVLLNKKKNALDDFGEEKIENVNPNFFNDLQTNDLFPEKNPLIDELSGLLTPSNPHKKEHMSCRGDSEIINGSSSKDTVLKSNYAMETKFSALPEYLLEDKTAINSENMEVNATLELRDSSLKDNTTLEIDSASSDNFNACSNSLDSNPPKMFDNVGPQTVERESSPLNKHIQITSEVNDNTEIDNTVKDGKNSVLPNLSSSKANSVFQALVHKLSVDNFELKGAKGHAVRGSKGKNKNSAKPKIFPIMENELKGLSMDMLDLLTSGNMADAIISSGEKHIKVHRAIVSARSSVLKEIFVKHKEDDLYRALVDIPPYILEDVIVFLYVGLVEIKSIKMVKDLQAVAEKYCIKDLIDICAKHIPK